MSDATRTEPSVRSAGGGGAAVGPALVVIWSADGARLGEALVVPRGVFVFGRGAAHPDDPHPRLTLAQQRPGAVRPAGPLSLSSVSRVQLRLSAADGRLRVEQLGRCEVARNGAAAARGCELAPGDVLSLGRQLAFLCVERPAWMEGEAPGEGHGFGEADAHGLVGESEAAWRLRREIAFLGPRAGHVLVLGESGTGKELVARAIHARSARCGRPLVARNAATIPEGLADAELFGNLKNYPNAGMPDRPGLVGRAHEATLFLDEFAELQAGVQAHLLRVLDQGDYQRLGEAEERRSNLRLIAATNRPVSALREDIVARFGLRLTTPPLGARREDIPLLIAHALRGIRAEDPAAVERFFPAQGPPRLDLGWVAALVRRPYRTNVRELGALLWEAIARSTGETLGEGVDPSVRAEQPADEGEGDEEDDPPGLTQAVLQKALDENNGSIEKTWKALGLANRYALRRLIRKYDLVVRRLSS